MKVVDVAMDLPTTRDEDIINYFKNTLLHKGEKGIFNYLFIFGPGRFKALGLTIEEAEKKLKELPPEELDKFIREKAKGLVVTPEDFFKQMDEAGVVWGVISAETNEETAKLCQKYPERFMGQVMVNPHEGMKSVRELERCVKELGMKCYYASPFRFGIPANDKKFYPLYAKSIELGIPVFIYSTMNYRTDLPMDVGRPLNLDEVARDFPEMKIVASCGGWPWVNEMVGVARRHQNIYIDMAFHRPKHLATPGSGWEMLMQFGNTLLQDRILFGSGWQSVAMPLKDMVKEMLELPLKESVKEKWLYGNALRFFGLS